ncbi:hypothetical protein D3C80_2005530 [compost metagenome]
MADQLAGLGVVAEAACQARIEGLNHRGAFDKGLQLRRQLAQQFLMEELCHIGIGLEGDRAQRLGIVRDGLFSIGG